MVMGEFSHDENTLSFAIEEGSTEASLVAGLHVQSITLQNGYDAKPSADPMGQITAKWDLPEDFDVSQEPFTVGLKKSEKPIRWLRR